MSNKLAKSNHLPEQHHEDDKRPVFSPAVDVYETKSDIQIIADMPGVEQSALDITFNDDILSLTGAQSEAVPEGFNLLHGGAKTGVFKRSFNILSDIDAEKISAKMNNGVLRIVLPKSEKAQPRKIEVTAD
ncbi:MAG: hypothetical protein A2020_04380 [Lentisphaerae bacterium GWF2_45_14]|nr:MAG: hypothetical protein A2020_04380 [Lentisphaerae bacterium GWF2_45_14]